MAECSAPCGALLVVALTGRGSVGIAGPVSRGTFDAEDAAGTVVGMSATAVSLGRFGEENAAPFEFGVEGETAGAVAVARAESAGSLGMAGTSSRGIKGAAVEAIAGKTGKGVGVDSD